MIKSDYDIKPLAAAVILHAMREAKHDKDARAWLQHDGLIFFDVCGVNVTAAHVQRWIRRGCKIPKRGALQLGT